MVLYFGLVNDKTILSDSLTLASKHKENKASVAWRYNKNKVMLNFDPVSDE